MLTHPLLDSVVCVFSSITDNPESVGSVIKVRTVWMEVFEVILQQESVLGKPLDRLQQEVLQLQLAALRLGLKLLGKGNQWDCRCNEGYPTLTSLWNLAYIWQQSSKCKFMAEKSLI